MAKTALAIQDIPANSGAQLTEATPDAVNGNMFPNDGNVVLVVTNSDAAAKTVTVASVPCSHGRTGDVVVNVAASSRAEIGPFSTDLFNQRAVDAGNVYVSWSASVNVKVCARRKV